MSKEPAKHVDDKVAPKVDTAAAIQQTADDRAQDGGEEGFIPNYHGYTPEQIQRMEEARYDDSAPPPVDDGLDAKREEAEKARQKELDQIEKTRQYDVAEADKAAKADKKAGWS